MTMSMNRAMSFLCTAHLVAMAAAVFGQARIGSAGEALIVVAFFAFNAAPVGVAWLTFDVTRSRELRRMMLVFVLGFSVLAFSAIYRAIAAQDAQSGLVFVSVPALGLVALAVIVLATALVIRVRSHMSH
jgi:hypothetical protein